MYANITNPANFQLQDFAQFGFRVITTDFIPVPGEQYRTLYVLQDAVVTATTQKGDDITSKAILAGTLLHGLFNSVSITSGRVLAYAAGRVTAEEIIALYEAYVVALGGTLENTQCAIDAINEEGVDLFADASLVMIPEGYATGVVYGQRPLTSDSQLTFTRASTATRVASNGLIERVRTNLALYSQDLSQTGTWVTSATTRVDSQTDPNGGTTASKFTATGANSNVIQTLTISSGIPYTWSFYAKSDSATDVNIRLDNNNGNFVQANMALTTSWQRFSITLNSNATTILCFLGGGLSFATGEVAYMAFAQLESGDIMTDYIPTTTTAVSVGPVANLPRIDYTGGGCGKLLLEPQRTNIALYSEQFDNAAWAKANAGTAVAPVVTANSVISPDGYQNAETIVFNVGAGTTTSDQSLINQAIATTSGQSYTFSVYLKGSVGGEKIVIRKPNNDYVAVTLTTEWQRFSVTEAAAGASYAAQFGLRQGLSGIGTINSTATIYAYGAQLELGSYVSSYVNTLGSTVTRLADECTQADVSGLLGSGVGTAFIDFELDGPDSQGNVTLTIGTSITNLVYLWVRTNGQITYETYQGGVSQCAISTSTGYANYGSRYKIAVVWANNDFAMYINGTFIGADTNGTGPTPTKLWLGQYFSANYKGARINQTLLFPTRLSNEQLQKLTSL